MEPSHPSSTIETSRLWLRPITPADASFADAEAQHSFLEGYQQYQHFNIGRWVVIGKEDGAFMGWCGLKLDTTTSETTLGFRLLKKYWNNAFSAEVANACITYGFTQLQLTKIVATVGHQNLAVIKVLQKVGMQEVQTQTPNGLKSEYNYEIKKLDFLNLQ